MDAVKFNEDFFEERFGDFNRDLLEEQIQEYDRRKREQPFDKEFVLQNLHFSKELPEKATTLLQYLIPAILEFSAKLDIRLRNPQHQVRFLTAKEFQQETGINLAGKIPLPASRLEFSSVTQLYTIIVILPPVIRSSEEIINITRTLFSKLIGEIYLNENVLPLEFYQQGAISSEATLTAGIPEKLSLLQEQEFPSTTLQHYGSTFAKKQKMSFKKQRNLVKRHLTSYWLERWQKQKLLPEEEKAIQDIFHDFVDYFRQNSSTVLASAIQPLRKLNKQLHFILPHELNAYEYFANDDPATFSACCL